MRVDAPQLPPPDATLPHGLDIAEDVFEPCPCTVSEFAIHRPNSGCAGCHGSGYRLTKRTYRSTPRASFSEQAALSQLATKDALLAKAARTLDDAAQRFAQKGHVEESAQTRAAACALREEAGLT
jgi:hypothetical protein